MNTKKSLIQPVILLAVAAVLITYFFPRGSAFNYQFNDGKPWQYELLTAPFDFPVYKTEHELKAEKDSLRALSKPYYRLEADVKARNIETATIDYQQLAPRDARQAECLKYAIAQMDKLYDKGIMTATELENLRQQKLVRVQVLKDNVAEQRNVSDFNTTKSAYEAILRNAPATVDSELLKACNIDRYLAENLQYDKETTDKILNEQIQSLSVSSGMVQKDQRIIDHGEVVDTRTYNILSSLKTVYLSKAGDGGRQAVSWIGQFILIFGILLCSGIYMASFCPEIFYSRRNMLFIVLGILTTCLLAEICARYSFISIYMLPFAIVPIVVRTFFDSHTALFTHLITILLCSLLAPFPHEFLILQIIAGIAVIFTLKEMTQRSQLVRCSICVFAGYTLFYLSLSLYQDADFSKINWLMLLYFGINFVLLMFSYLLIYLVEKIFGYVSSITLVELSNINTPILKKLSETCPGTFQHVNQVSILAAEAGAVVGADTQLLRTGALYHDIGKMNNPSYFTENQAEGVNPHDRLPFEESAQIVIRHVADGVKMAEKAGLPKKIIDFIRTHHGKGKTKFFYNSWRNANPDKTVDDKLFTYPGPNPFSKETGILMMADAVEASARSLKEYTEDALKQQVDRIIDSQIADGLLADAPITFREIGEIKAAFTDKLRTMYHSRIVYPELKSEKKRTVTQ
ncbi:MAG: HDIG domain-containing protein [Tannerella sp.]|jgi:putative nucleotidyltransferase with HDIG domain|nr:HDIG domain-containing protein [Tannerella sp.]